MIDEVNPFWYGVSADGTVVPSSIAEDADKLSAWREMGLAVLPTVAYAPPSVVGPDVRDYHVAQIVEMVERMGYDGIDIDYEGFPAGTRDDFSEFIELLAEEMHSRDLLLSVAVHAKTEDAPDWDAAAAQDWERLAAAADVLRIMTYDYHGVSTGPGPIAPPEWVADVLGYAESVTDLSDVRMGVHFYGYAWQRGGATATDVTWADSMRWVESFGLEAGRDPVSMEMMIEADLPRLPSQTLYLADSVGLEYKLNLILERFPELGGVSIWGVGGEDPANWDVLRRLRPADCSLFGN